MKYTYSQEKIHTFGGINFADRILNEASVYGHIDQELGPRGPLATYRYSDLFRSYLLLALCGGDCAEDIGGEPAQLDGFAPPSPDTLLRLQKELGQLATEKELATSKGGSLNELCNNGRMNGLPVGLPVRTGQLVPGAKGKVLDFDDQFIPADKYDSKKGYKKKDGYFPCIASIRQPSRVRRGAQRHRQREVRAGRDPGKDVRAPAGERHQGVPQPHGLRLLHRGRWSPPWRPTATISISAPSPAPPSTTGHGVPPSKDETI